MKKIVMSFILSMAGSFFGGYLYVLSSEGAAGMNWAGSLFIGIMLWGWMVLRDRSIFSIVKR